MSSIARLLVFKAGKFRSVVETKESAGLLCKYLITNVSLLSSAAGFLRSQDRIYANMIGSETLLAL